MNVRAPPSTYEASTQVAQTLVCDIPSEDSQTEVCPTFLDGIKRRLARERRRRKVGRAYDMALEIARVIPQDGAVLDVGCGNGYIAHHLSAMLGQSVIGIDVMNMNEAPIDYRRYDGKHFPVEDNSVDAVLLCYVLHHAQDVRGVLDEVRRVVRDDGLIIIYEDIPRTWWDKGVCWIHNRQWKDRTGPCTFRGESEWCELFDSLGLELVNNRQLSRWRSLVHPVQRVSFSLRRRLIAPAASEANLPHTTLCIRPGGRGPRRSSCTYRRHKLSSAVESQRAAAQFEARPIP
jgi:SAM-dependent methyltransferase